MVVQNSVQDGMDNRAHLFPWVDLWHRKQSILRTIEKKREEGMGGYRAQHTHHDNQHKANRAHHFLLLIISVWQEKDLDDE